MRYGLLSPNLISSNRWFDAKTSKETQRMNGETIKRIVRDYYDEVWKGNLALIDTLMAPDYINRDPATPAPNGEVHGREGMKQLVSTLRGAIPDIVMTID